MCHPNIWWLFSNRRESKERSTQRNVGNRMKNKLGKLNRELKWGLDITPSPTEHPYFISVQQGEKTLVFIYVDFQEVEGREVYVRCYSDPEPHRFGWSDREVDAAIAVVQAHIEHQLAPSTSV